MKTDAVVREVCARLSLVHPQASPGRILAVVVRVIADLSRVSVPTDSGVSLDDYARVVESMADRALSREQPA